MQKTIRIQPISEQDRNLRKELHRHTPSQRMELLMQWIDQTAKDRRLERVATIRHVPVREANRPKDRIDLEELDR